MSAPEQLLADPAVSEQEQQLSLPGASEMFAAVGLAELPHGAERLTKKELAFAVAYLRTGNATRAAEEAGYSDPRGNSAKLLKRTDILRFLAPALTKVAHNAEALVTRVAQRSCDLHTELEELRTRVLRDWKRERELLTCVNQTDSLLANLLGKVSVTVNGTINHNHTGKVEVAVPQAALPVLAQMRRDVVQARLASAVMTTTGGRS